MRVNLTVPLKAEKCQVSPTFIRNRLTRDRLTNQVFQKLIRSSAVNHICNRLLRMHLKPSIASIAPLCTTGLIVAWGLAIPSLAQVIPDGTLTTTVSPTGNDFIINNGNQVGNNLFHSFSQFSVPTGGSAVFNNAPTIQNIFARVTGGNVSNIDGLIRANGSANLFLMNPAGILFGPNARLNIGGSFTATTAHAIQFADGTKFSATNPASSLLTVSVPVGLQMGNNSGAIAVQGTGRNTNLNGVTPVSGLTGVGGLQVAAGKTLALVGGDIAIDGGVLSAPGGRIELGSVVSGDVSLSSIPQGFSLNYANASSFGNVRMTQQALASVRGVGAGAVQIQGKQINIRDGSIVAVQNLGSQTAGDITVNATESLSVVGMTPNFSSSSGLINETIAPGAAGKIVIATPRLVIDQGSLVLTRTYSAAPSGDIVVNASDILVGGVAPGNPSVAPIFGVLLAATYGSGQGGNLAIATQNLVIIGGGNVGTRNFSSGNGGNVTVRADTVRVSSANTGTNQTLVSLLSANVFGSGNAGNLHLDTRILSIEAGGVVSVSSVSTGNAGNLTIKASEAIDVAGIKDANNPSYIGAVARNFNFLGGNAGSTANAGSITVNTPTLSIRNGGTVFVANQVLGNAGNISITADLLKLDTGGSISASTLVGEGGNINLQIKEGIIMRHGSLISATAGGRGNGGNIAINAPVIAGFENSDIIANAFQGRGGNIQITTRGIFGLKFRPQLTPENDITASSQFGVSGNVQINQLALDPTSGLEALPMVLADPTQQIATGCASNSESRFVATGRGGVPQNPTQQVWKDRTWEDIRDLSAYRQRGIATVPAPQPAAPVIIEASTWHQTADGVVELVAQPTPAALSTVVNCSGDLTTMVHSDTHRE